MRNQSTTITRSGATIQKTFQARCGNHYSYQVELPDGAGYRYAGSIAEAKQIADQYQADVRRSFILEMRGVAR